MSIPLPKLTRNGPQADPFFNGADKPDEPGTDPRAPVTMERHKTDMKRTTLTALVMVVLGAATPALMDLGTRLMGQKGRMDFIEDKVDDVQQDVHGLIVALGRQHRPMPDGGTP